MSKSFVLCFLMIFHQTFANEFKEFMKNYNKVYSSIEEEEYRRNIFEQNLKIINEHNQEFEKNLTSFEMTVNKFADMEHSEVLHHNTGRELLKQKRHILPRIKISIPKEKSLPKSLDWRKYNMVTEVKDQGACGSCWAFSVSGALEAQFYKKFGELISLSAQQLVDCNQDENIGNWGCSGGFEEPAFDYIQKYGIMKSFDYPYIDGKSECKQNGSISYRTKKYQVVPISEYELKKAVALIGPISIAVHADLGFEYYKNGVYISNKCRNEDRFLNHAALVVGYGTDSATGYDYWIVKNSWGTGWGDGGYIKLRRNFKNMCGVATNGLYAFFA